jgi:hypothetical protein
MPTFMSTQGDTHHRLTLQDWQEAIVDRLGNDPWVQIYLSRRTEEDDVNLFCALIQKSKARDTLKDVSWNFSIGDGKPGLIVTHRGRSKRTEYARFGSSDAIEHFVFKRYFGGAKQSYVEISEEFRLFHNLYFDIATQRLTKITEEGDEEDAARITPTSAEVQLKLLLQFLAIKNMCLVVAFDIRRYSKIELKESGMGETTHKIHNDQMIAEYRLRDHTFLSDDRIKSFAWFIGKKLLTPKISDKKGVWPYEEKKKCERFLVGQDRRGKEKYFSCDPSKLSDYFGANPGNPHYLTPVFFRRDVLSKYYANPEKYSVEDGYLRCCGLWGVQIDNNHKDSVIVFLGDLGRDLPHKEQLYWKSFNIPPGKPGVSSVSYKRSFLGEFADPEKPDLLFKQVFESFQKKWSKSYDWPLFKPLGEADKHFYHSLRIPMNDSQSEFDSQTLSLAKVLVDSINEKKLAEALSSLPPNSKGITKLEEYLRAQGLTSFEPHITFLRNLYNLRHGAGHRKGKDFEAAAEAFELARLRGQKAFEAIIGAATALIRYLEVNLLSMAN